MSEPKYYTVFEADSAYLKNLGDTNTYFSEFEVRLKTLEALGGTISDGVATLLDVEKAILEQLTGIASATSDIFELRKEIAKAQGIDVSEDFNIWDVAQQEPPVGPKIFTIRFLNWDGTVLETVEVEEGQTPVYSGSTPTKESDETYNYTFNGWLPEISAANGNVDYVAQFTATEIPSGPDLTIPYVTFKAEEAGSTLGLNRKSMDETLEYSTDKTTWNTFDTSTSVNLTNIGDEVYVRGKLTANGNSSNYTQFKMTGKIAAIGNCNAIWDYEDLNAVLKRYCGYNMFKDCTSLTTAPELPATTLANDCYGYMFYNCTSLINVPSVLPATTLVDYCYRNMFYGCTSLTTAPALPATTLANYCYQSMFSGCTALTTAPSVLPATKLVTNCYYNMFYNCTALTTAPELPATILAYSCYSYMFYGCTSLTTSPILPATTLASSCYQRMFQGCSALTEITCLATNISAANCTNGWLSGVPSSGTFYKDPSMTSWTTSANGIPSGWTVVDYVA